MLHCILKTAFHLTTLLKSSYLFHVSCVEYIGVIHPSTCCCIFHLSRFFSNNKQTSHGLWGSVHLAMPICPHFFRQVILTGKLGHTGLVFGVQSGFIRDHCVQDYKSLCAAATICATLVNIQTHRYRQTAFWPAYISSSAGWTKNKLHTVVVIWVCACESWHWVYCAMQQHCHS